MSHHTPSCGAYALSAPTAFHVLPFALASSVNAVGNVNRNPLRGSSRTRFSVCALPKSSVSVSACCAVRPGADQNVPVFPSAALLAAYAAL